MNDSTQPCTDLERYLFDLTGNVVIPNALAASDFHHRFVADA